jgi:tight adherence protein C
MLSLILVMWFGSILMLVLGLAARPAPTRIERRVERLIEKTGPSPLSVEAELRAPLSERVLRPALHSLARLAMRLSPGGTKVVQARLEALGRPSHLGVREFLGLRVLAAGAAAAAAIAGYRLSGSHSQALGIVGGFTIAVVLLLLPDFLLQQAIERRRVEIRKTLPDILDLLIVSVEAGLGFDGAIDKVVEKMKGPFPDELRRVLQEMQLGKKRVEALRDMAARIEVNEVSTFVAAIYQADQLGVSMARVLHVQAETMRVARSQRIREMAAKLPVKMLFPLVLFIFPAIFFIILGPGVISIIKAFAGGGL